MPVLNLPKDERFEKIGQGLGGLIGAIAQNAQQQQAQAGVAEVMQDQTMSEPQKYAKILKDHGPLGQELYTKAVQNQFIQSKIKDITSEIGKRTVETAAAQAKLDKEFPLHLQQIQANTANVASETTARDTKLGPEVAQIGAQTGLTQANTGNVQSEEATRRAILPGTLAAQPIERDVKAAQAVNIASEADERNALLGGKVAAQPVARGLTQAETEKTQVETGLGAAKLPKVMVENELAKIQLDMIKGTLSPEGGSSRLDDLSKRLGLTAPQKELAKSAWMAEKDPLKKDEAFLKEVARLPSAPVDVRKETGADAEAAISSKKFLDLFRKGGAEKLGFGDVFSTLDPRDLAAVKGAMEKRGLSTGDPEFVGMFNSSLQQIASAATAGGGIGFAQGRVDLAKETTATISQSPLHALIALDETADRKLAKLQNMRKNMSPSEPREGVDDAIKHYQDVKAITGTLNAYVVDKGAPGERQVVLFDGSQVDPKTFKKIVDGKKEYKVGSGFGTGAEFVEQARIRNLDPETYIKQLQTKFGTGAR
jgi:hypothetical protein